jgi:hypothetical protein
LDAETAGLMQQLIAALDELCTIECACCGRKGYHKGRGWIVACYKRWLRAGKPAGGPPPPMSRSEIGRRRSSAAAGRREDYEWLTREQGLSLYEAAERLEVTSRTAWRYEQRLRQQARQAA